MAKSLPPQSNTEVGGRHEVRTASAASVQSPHFRGAVDTDGVVEAVSHEAVAELHRRAIRRVRENDPTGQLVIESADRNRVESQLWLRLERRLRWNARFPPPQGRIEPGLRQVESEVDRHMLRPRSDAQADADLIRPRALAEEMEEPILRAFRAVRITAGACRDELYAFALPVAQDPEEVRRERFSLLAPREMAADRVEVGAETLRR